MPQASANNLASLAAILSLCAYVVACSTIKPGASTSISSTTEQAAVPQREFKYSDGKCVNGSGEEGLNPPTSFFVSKPVEKDIQSTFGMFGPGGGGTYSYYELVDGECTDLTSGVVALPVNEPRPWIQTLNLKGARSGHFMGNFDTPRALLEGAQVDQSMRVYSYIALSHDKFTTGSLLQTRCYKFEDIVHDWSADITEPNDLFCTSGGVVRRDNP
jgi:hypothetical protein